MGSTVKLRIWVWGIKYYRALGVIALVRSAAIRVLSEHSYCAPRSPWSKSTPTLQRSKIESVRALRIETLCTWCLRVTYLWNHTEQGVCMQSIFFFQIFISDGVQGLPVWKLLSNQRGSALATWTLAPTQNMYSFFFFGKRTFSPNRRFKDVFIDVNGCFKAAPFSYLYVNGSESTRF